MIPRMRAIAIDDQQSHLDAIHNAATRAGFGCLPLLFPQDTDSDKLKALELDRAHIRMIITDLHLSTTSETSDATASYALIGGLIGLMCIPKWTPYVLVLWTQYSGQLEELRKYLEERLSLEQMPGLLIGLDKADYGIPNGTVNHEKLWSDLREKIGTSRGLNVLLQWEKEVIQATDNVVRKLLEAARSSKKQSIQIDDELDRVLSLVAQTATSLAFASTEPRAAANGGLLPLLIDEMEHLDPNFEQVARWKSALAQAVGKVRIEASNIEAAVLNDALHISRDGMATGADRGAVISKWHTKELFQTTFGVDKEECFEVFGLMSWPITASIKYVQIEGLCDSTQKKKGVVPFTLACEVPGDTKLKEKGLPASVEVSPIYLSDKGKECKLIVNLRYFFTSERGAAQTNKADFRLRESLINKWAVAWANHAIRPGAVEFHAKTD